jgi:hypothetical protein
MGRVWNGGQRGGLLGRDQRASVTVEAPMRPVMGATIAGIVQIDAGGVGIGLGLQISGAGVIGVLRCDGMFRQRRA